MSLYCLFFHHVVAISYHLTFCDTDTLYALVLFCVSFDNERTGIQVVLSFVSPLVLVQHVGSQKIDVPTKECMASRKIQLVVSRTDKKRWVIGTFIHVRQANFLTVPSSSVM